MPLASFFQVQPPASPSPELSDLSGLNQIIPSWLQWNSFFFPNCFWWTEAPFCIYSPLPPLRGQATVEYHPRWQPIQGLAVHCRLGRLPDSNPGLQVYSLVSLPMSHHCSTAVKFSLSVSLGRSTNVIWSAFCCMFAYRLIVLWLCIILILEMYTRYFDHHTYITRFAPNSNLA